MQITNKDLHLEVNNGWLFLIQNLPVNKIDSYCNGKDSFKFNLLVFITVQGSLKHWWKYFICMWSVV